MYIYIYTHIMWYSELLRVPKRNTCFVCCTHCCHLYYLFYHFVCLHDYWSKSIELKSCSDKSAANPQELADRDPEVWLPSARARSARVESPVASHIDNNANNNRNNSNVFPAPLLIILVIIVIVVMMPLLLLLLLLFVLL